MDDFRVIYKMLSVLHEAMDCDELDADQLTSDALGVSPQKLRALWAMLAEKGLVSGVTVKVTKGGRVVSVIDPRLTYDGLQFLQENGMMRKAANLARGVIDVIGVIR